MRRFFKQHQEWTLAVIGLVVFAGIVAAAVWTVSTVSVQVGSAMSIGDASAGKIEFKVEQFQNLDLRGLGGKKR